MGTKPESLSAVSIVPAVEWPAYELISGRTPDMGDGVVGYSQDDFYAQFAPAVTQACLGDGHAAGTHHRARQGKLRYATATGMKYTDAIIGIDTSEDIPLGTGYWMFPALPSETDYNAENELRLKIDDASL